MMTASDTAEKKAEDAMNAYRLLRNWTTVPGTQSDGTFVPNQFKAWVEAAVKECTETGHLSVALSQIGQVLVNAPKDPDGLWIHCAIAESLDAVDTEDMRRGYYIGRFNARGARHVDPSGAGERKLEEEIVVQAESLEIAGYTRFAGILRSLAETYAQEAKRIVSEHANRIKEQEAEDQR